MERALNEVASSCQKWRDEVPAELRLLLLSLLADLLLMIFCRQDTRSSNLRGQHLAGIGFRRAHLFVS